MAYKGQSSFRKPEYEATDVKCSMSIINRGYIYEYLSNSGAIEVETLEILLTDLSTTMCGATDFLSHCNELYIFMVKRHLDLLMGYWILKIRP